MAKELSLSNRGRSPALSLALFFQPISVIILFVGLQLRKESKRGPA